MFGLLTVHSPPVQSAPNIPLVLVMLVIVAFLMASKITLSAGPLQMTLYKARKRRKRPSASRRRPGR